MAIGDYSPQSSDYQILQYPLGSIENTGGDQGGHGYGLVVSQLPHGGQGGPYGFVHGDVLSNQVISPSIPSYEKNTLMSPLNGSGSVVRYNPSYDESLTPIIPAEDYYQNINTSPDYINSGTATQMSTSTLIALLGGVSVIVLTLVYFMFLRK